MRLRLTVELLVSDDVINTTNAVAVEWLLGLLFGTDGTTRECYPDNDLLLYSNQEIGDVIGEVTVLTIETPDQQHYTRKEW